MGRGAYVYYVGYVKRYIPQEFASNFGKPLGFAS